MSIFTEENKAKDNWMKWDKVGAAIEGTLIGVREQMNSLNGKMQTIYELKVNGDVWNVGSKPAIDNQMRHVTLGQIVGFKFEETKKNPQPGMNDTKIIKAYHNPEVTDAEWLKENDNNVPAVPASVIPENSTAPATPEAPAAPTVPFGPEPGSVEEQIIALAKEKLAATSEEDAKAKVMEKTELAFIKQNFDKIFEKLTAL